MHNNADDTVYLELDRNTAAWVLRALQSHLPHSEVGSEVQRESVTGLTAFLEDFLAQRAVPLLRRAS